MVCPICQRRMNPSRTETVQITYSGDGQSSAMIMHASCFEAIAGKDKLEELKRHEVVGRYNPRFP